MKTIDNAKVLFLYFQYLNEIYNSMKTHETYLVLKTCEQFFIS